jgi:hypothetical protein
MKLYIMKREMFCYRIWGMLVVVFLASSCGGSLSEEQRKKMRDQMALHEIKKVTETEITEAAMERGRTIMEIVIKANGNMATIDSLEAATKTTITWIEPGKSNAEAVEQQLVDAYIAGAATGAIEDNLQKIRNAEGAVDSLLFTRPIVKTLPDGAVQVEGTWNIKISQRDLILSMGKK